jgi:Flp pilus assembly protein TadB
MNSTFYNQNSQKKNSQKENGQKKNKNSKKENNQKKNKKNQNNQKKNSQNSQENSQNTFSITNFLFNSPPINPKYASTTMTVSGLNNSSYLNYFISILSGIFIFVVAPFIANQFGNVTLSALVNVFPTGILIALFIKEREFGDFFNKLLYAPLFNVVVNIITYTIYYFFQWSPISIIILNISIWFCACILAYFYG